LNQEDKQFMTQFAIVIGALVVFTIAMLFLARYLMAINRVHYGPLIAKQTQQRIKPVGETTIGKVAQPASTATTAAGGVQASGKQTFAQACAACHQTGSMGAPKLGSKADWASRIKKGKQTLYTHAINGLGAMPPKGGHPELSAAQVKAAVDYMVSQVSGGGRQQAQAAPKGGQKTAQAGGAQAMGQQTFAQACAACHQSGAMGAPKLGSKADWASRIKKGKQTLYTHAINGFGAMPPKGGDPSLSTAQVKAAVDYMLNAAQ
jgi:cytochrome c5